MHDSTEQILKGWKLRQPSALLRDQIFTPELAPAPVMVASAAFDLPALMRWLVPALGCFALVSGTMMEPTLDTPKQVFGPIAEQRMAFSGSEHNNLPATTVEWTFGRPAAASNSSLARADRTNSLMK